MYPFSDSGSQDVNLPYNLGGYGNEVDYKQQVVAVGTPLPTTTLPLGMISKQGNIGYLLSLFNFP